ncbi:hypothetical protein BAUCODRAFT_180486 [Baudoinia panamericana UAMH 10762]|uniref:Uncharacterized protein n=1 Tax=Baudoinia panamericana (strain UAMH 10762) TaxID=717646 RepID=M2NNA3_BAUPA|nr:uncharacterized protein BAUCODRAFT_180486 [Baudoinia panamericana UAMH 10762]EMD00711.1 hypothetical protein BAUCODRAFT_180486 [Baudoinia panamericana UAMH 10762]
MTGIAVNIGATSSQVHPRTYEALCCAPDDSPAQILTDGGTVAKPRTLSQRKRACHGVDPHRQPHVHPSLDVF